MQRGRDGEDFTHCKQHLFADISLFTSGQDDEATAPSFSICYARIEASIALLEALIASLLPAGGTAKEVTFPTAIKLLIAVGWFFAWANGERETLPSFTLIGAYNTLL